MLNIHFGATAPRPRLRKPTAPPTVEQAAAHEWSAGWWAGIAVGMVNGAGMAVLLGWLR